MKILGIDFTSSPSRSKPITCAIAQHQENRLTLEGMDYLTGFEQFETLLASDGPWVAGMDFPFSQSYRLIDNLQWPRQWSDYMQRISRLSRDQFVTLLEDYKAKRPQGDKEHRREVDVLAASISPQKLYGVPVAKMFYEGARRLYRSNGDIVPLRRCLSDKVVVEVYPAIVARRLIGRRSYKSDQKSKQTGDRWRARKSIIDGLLGNELQAIYGLKTVISASLQQQLVDDASGDSLDAVLCALQAGWAYGKRRDNYGIPLHASSLEGWIADPLVYI